MLVSRNDFTKALHGALLQQVGVDATRIFWSDHPLVRDTGAVTPAELAHHVWQEEAFTSVAWTMGVANDLEPFLIERGVCFETFLETTRRFANHGSFVQSRHVLSWLSPILVALFRFGDPYRLLLHAAKLATAKLSPGVVCALVPWRRRGAVEAPTARFGSLWLTYPGLAEGRIPPWDFTTLTGRQIQVSPRMFGLPPFDPMVVLSDARRPESIPWKVPCATTDGRFFVDAVPHGRVMPFSHFLREVGYELERYDRIDPDVVVIDRDYVCPSRGRVVLSAGCAYGAPGYLTRLGWSAKRPRVHNPLAHLLEQGGREYAEIHERLEALQLAYLDAVTTVIPVVFSAADESLHVAGRYVCRGISARILRECLRISRDEARQEFTFRELKRKRELVSHPKNTGLEIRLRRLRAALSAADCGLALAPTGRGRFALVCSSKLRLVEAE